MQDAVKGHWITASHTLGLATAHSCSCSTQVGFALAKNAEFLTQQHHCWEVQQTSFTNWVDLSQQKCRAKEIGLSEAIKTRPCSKQFPRLEVLLPFAFLPFTYCNSLSLLLQKLPDQLPVCNSHQKRLYLQLSYLLPYQLTPISMGWPTESRTRLCTTQINCTHGCVFFSADSAIKDRTAAESQDRCL